LALAKFLKSFNTDGLGTIKINKQAMSKKIKDSRMQKIENFVVLFALLDGVMRNL
jgi:hypothetical protein